MRAAPEFLVAQTLPGLVPVDDARVPLRVLIASLVQGGAERIVLEWLAAEALRGRAVELAVLHPRANAWRVPRGVTALVRDGDEPVEHFVAALSEYWKGAPGVVSTHLIDDGVLAKLWDAGLRTVPTVHNARPGWRNDPLAWAAPRVPFVLACAERVRDELLASGCRVPVYTVRHKPAMPARACDSEQRRRVREEWRIGDGTFLVLAVGAFKPQKDFPRAVDVLAALRHRRDAVLAIAGGAHDAAQVAELERTLERALAHRVEAHVRLPGFVDPIGPWYAAADAVLVSSRYEGLSMASREALSAGLPVVALDVGGQREIDAPALSLLRPDATATSIAAALAAHPLRARLEPLREARVPRIWSVPMAHASTPRAPLDTLFVTANLNAGGAQRSLANLAPLLARGRCVGVAVCGESTHPAFAAALGVAGIECFRAAPSPDPFGVAESLLAHAGARAVRTLCFWNADPRVKLLVAKFAPPTLRLADVSPGAYAFEELEGERAFAAACAFSAQAYYARLDLLVLKYSGVRPPCANVRVISNGVAMRDAWWRPSSPARFLVSGRIVPSKRLETVIEAFARVRARFPHAELHVVGQAEPRHAQYATRLFASAAPLDVRFRGAMPGLEHLAETFTAAVVLGTHQGCPNAVLEAMSAGIPVIANASGGTAEMLAHEETGWLLREHAASAELADAMAACASEPALAERCANKALARVRAEFSLDAMAAQYAQCL
jgi:glycosyltransferase involved in cell wall biosynthesis